MSDKEWRLGWTSTEYVTGRWQRVTEIREFDDDSDLSDLVCVVTTERANRIMDGQRALAVRAEDRRDLSAKVERLRAVLETISRRASEREGDESYCACATIEELADTALSENAVPDGGG
jgi:hypothetical protein